MKKRRLFLGSSAVVIVMSLSRPAPAIFCENCADQLDQLWSNAKQAEQYLNEVQQLQNQLNMYANMVRNTVMLPQQIFYQVQSVVSRLQNISNAASLLSGNSGNIITRLNSLTGTISGTGYSITSIPNQMTTWANTVGNAGKQLGTAVEFQLGDLTNNARLVEMNQANSNSADGQLKAIQAGNELAANNATLLNHIAQTDIAMAQTLSTKLIIDTDRQASEDSALTHFATPQPVATTGNGGY